LLLIFKSRCKWIPKVINHIDFDRLNNVVSNLEIVSPRENTNKKHLNTSSNSTGVSWHKEKSKWISQIYYNGRLKFLGYFKTESEASNAYQNELLTISTKPLLVAGAVN
jgi:AP2 domain.